MDHNLAYNNDEQMTQDADTDDYKYEVTDDKYAGPSTCNSGAFYECVCVCYCCCTTSTLDDQQVWSAGYVDELVLRDETTATTATYSDTTGFNYITVTPSTVRLFVQQDANYNVTALTRTNGTVDERFLYDPYGNQKVLSPSWTSTTDAYNWLYGFQGGRTDAVSGLVHFGARDYSPSDGAWVEPDPAGYVDGVNLYQIEEGNSAIGLDPSGLEDKPAATQPTQDILYAKQHLDEASLPATKTDPGATGRGYVEQLGFGHPGENNTFGNAGQRGGFVPVYKFADKDGRCLSIDYSFVVNLYILGAKNPAWNQRYWYDHGKQGWTNDDERAGDLSHEMDHYKTWTEGFWPALQKEMDPWNGHTFATHKDAQDQISKLNKWVIAVVAQATLWSKSFDEGALRDGNAYAKHPFIPKAPDE